MSKEWNKITKRLNAKAKRQILATREYYSLRSILGNDWAMFLLLLGGREAGKSYAVTEFFLRQYKLYGRPFYWMRLTDTAQQKLLTNNAEKLIDPDLRRRWNIETFVKGTNVYEVTKRSKPDKNGKTKILEKKLMARVFALSTFYTDKGSGLFDKDFLNDPNMYYNIAFDEMNREKSEKNTFDIVYSFVNQLENLVRSTKRRIRIICIGNTLEEASDLLCSFNFIPENFGRFYLRKKRAVVEYIEPSEAYKLRRKGTIADILMPEASTFTNEVKTDTTLIYKYRLIRPVAIIKFSKVDKENFVMWDSGVIKKWNGEKCKSIIAMRPYLDEVFNLEARNNVFQMFDSRGFKFRDLNSEPNEVQREKIAFKALNVLLYLWIYRLLMVSGLIPKV